MSVRNLKAVQGDKLGNVHGVQSTWRREHKKYGRRRLRRVYKTLIREHQDEDVSPIYHKRYFGYD